MNPPKQRSHNVTPTNALNANIRAELARRELPQAALAEPLGFATPAAVSKRLSGDIPWTYDQLHTVARFLGVRLATLLPDDGQLVDVTGIEFPGNNA